ncbi:D-glycero-beta-D-manno-heptose 1-phosphate adenylyltransferase [Sporomusa sp. KB1]|jgi:rfaE bifunctional protein nucleotidyltransferase chain/domain|uniref:D-glycero-beta-D-manno-heptose 1-phosphate adenylyltransferase n=1 Tax=Sporomusa sp. KB1 TaxID=943346 RepID=UPI00119D2C5D|nr:D-glycero-beta-D-manno-heptose 1-phosphate adenylyltransferase [Sporomusa sp. KB1]TWH45305.1 rfaE bifunctional protein nucleotidyltransferase chain/domain [Sporomusa sp. KB1]
MKIVDQTTSGIISKTLQAAGKTVVFTNGCFDILHAGHVRYLAGARQLGDCLIVGLNSDSSVRQLKGPNRPVNCQEDRAEVLAGLAAVDYVVVFDETTAENLVAVVQPDVYAKGGDYTIETLPESKIVAAHGGRIVLVPEVPGRSSSNIIKKISREV